jgi:hypothetical protein
MNVRNISHFEGLNTVLARGKASLFTLLEAENIRVHTGEAEIRPGQRYLNADEFDIAADINIVYQYSREYRDIDGNQQVYTVYVFSAGARLYSWLEGADVAIWLNTSALHALTSSDIWLTEYMDWAFVCNGKDKLYCFDLIDFFEVGIDAPAAPTISIIAGGLGTVGYRAYKYRWVRATRDGSGNLIDYVCSPMSAVGYSAIFSLTQAPMISLAQTSDNQVTNIELYCTEVFASLDDIDDSTVFYRLDADLVAPYYNGLPNAAQTYNDTTSDYTLHDDAAYHPAEDTSISWTNPPAGLDYIIQFKDRLYGVPKADPSILAYSDLGVPESWYADNWIDIRRDDGDVMTGCVITNNSLYIFKRRSIWVLTGDPDAAAILQVRSGGDRASAQTEFGLGCTAPRSIATFGDTVAVFYSSIYGVYMISGGELSHLSRNISGVLGLSDATAGAIYTDNNGEVFYVLSPPSGNAWVFHLASKSIVATDDNGVAITAKLRTAFVNLRNADMDAVVKKVQVQKRDMYDGFTMTLYNEHGERHIGAYDGNVRRAGVNGVAGRLFSLLFTWTLGVLESLTFMFTRRRGH